MMLAGLAKAGYLPHMIRIKEIDDVSTNAYGSGDDESAAAQNR